MTGIGRWLPRGPGNPLPPDSRVDKWRHWIEGAIESEVVTIFWHRAVYRRVAEITQHREPQLPASYFFDQLSMTYASSQASAVRRQADRHSRVISLGRLITEIHDDPQRLSRERFVSQYDIDEQHFGNEVFDRRFAGVVGDYIDPGVVASDLVALDDETEAIAAFVDRQIAHSDARALSSVPTYAELNGAIDAVGDIFRKYSLLLTCTSWPDLVPVPQYDWEAVFREPWLLPPGRP